MFTVYSYGYFYATVSQWPPEGHCMTYFSKWAERPLACLCTLHCVSKNDTDLAHYNFDVDQPILVIFDRDVAETVCYQMVICCPTSP